METQRVEERERESKGFSFLFVSHVLVMGVSLISSGGGGSSGGGIARVLADIAPHGSNKTSGAFAQLLSLLSTPPIGLHECAVLLPSLSPLCASLSLAPSRVITPLTQQ